jgi:hypothetical protein
MRPPRAPSRIPRPPTGAELSRTGAALRRIRTSRVDLDWVQGPGPTDIWIWQADGGDHVEMSFFGRCVLHRSAGLSTGLLREGGGTPYAEDAGLIELENELSRATLAAALGILLAAPADVTSPPIVRLIAALRAALEAGRGPEEPNI